MTALALALGFVAGAALLGCAGLLQALRLQRADGLAELMRLQQHLAAAEAAEKGHRVELIKLRAELAYYRGRVALKLAAAVPDAPDAGSLPRPAAGADLGGLCPVNEVRAGEAKD